jgi:hypothetical protein
LEALDGLALFIFQLEDMPDVTRGDKIVEDKRVS